MEPKAIQLVPLSRIEVRSNIRERLVESEQVALALSIKHSGILVPLLGHREGAEIVVDDGHRRLDAAIRAGLEDAPMIVADHAPTPAELLTLQLVANCQRSGLKTMERVRAIDRLIRDSSWSAAEVSQRLGGPSEATISKLLTLLVLPRQVQDLIDVGRIPMSSAYAIATVTDAAERMGLIGEVLNGRLTRDKLVAEIKTRKSNGEQAKSCRRARPRRSRLAISLGNGCSVTAKPNVTVKVFVSGLRDLLQRCDRLEPQSELADAVKTLADPQS